MGPTLTRRERSDEGASVGGKTTVVLCFVKDFATFELNKKIYYKVQIEAVDQE